MNRIILITLTLIMCISICACNGKANTTEQSMEQSNENTTTEIVDIKTLLDSVDNQAKAELNIGKATTMYVRVKTIYSDYCEVSHVFSATTSKIYMPKEKLADLNKGKYMVVYAILDSVELNGSSFSFVFKDGQTQDISRFDDYVRNTMSRYSAYDIAKKHSRFLTEYADSRGSDLIMRNDDEISTFITGNWYRSCDTGVGILGTLALDCTFYRNGKVKWEFWDYYSGYGSSTTEWSVKNGALDAFLSGVYVYKISDDIFVYGDEVFARG